MPHKVFKPKSSRSRAREALARLRGRWEKEHEDEEWDAGSEPVITPLLKAVEGGIPHVVMALRSHDDDDAQSFLEEWDRCCETDRKFLRIEDIAFAAGIGSLRLSEIAQTSLFLYGQMKTNMLMASHLPGVVEKSLKLAKTTKGIFDREMMLKAGNILPMAKGAQVAIQNNYGEKKEEAPQTALPLWKSAEDRLREIHDMTEPKRLPSPASPPVMIGGHIDRMQEQTVEILRGE